MLASEPVSGRYRATELIVEHQGILFALALFVQNLLFTFPGEKASAVLIYSYNSTLSLN